MKRHEAIHTAKYCVWCKQLEQCPRQIQEASSQQPTNQLTQASTHTRPKGAQSTTSTPSLPWLVVPCAPPPARSWSLQWVSELTRVVDSWMWSVDEWLMGLPTLVKNRAGYPPRTELAASNSSLFINLALFFSSFSFSRCRSCRRIVQLFFNSRRSFRR